MSASPNAAQVVVRLDICASSNQRLRPALI
jgi:hypothetical protein